MLDPSEKVSDHSTNDLPRRSRSLSRMHQSKPAYNRSYDRIFSFPGHPLASVRSEGSVTLRKNLEEGRKITRRVPPAQVKNTDSKEGHENDDLSDEDEILVRINSPSGLSFNHAS
ncbi:hypothetical protein HRI_000030100 [Hibiscus trionum]|uniref:Uncharacterized protein n=1 Tax=Hibiscus trionum TaxID=183268 RepID=A0A9W7GSP0_HIBTR|nr:hypothetical protein HRI_000030100 [Hibiscus trionum]